MIQVVTRKSTKVVRRTELKANLKSMSGTGSTGSVITSVIIETPQYQVFRSQEFRKIPDPTS